MSSVPEHPRAYLATPMTGLSGSELAAIVQAADHAGAACEAAGFEVYDPRDETSPDQHPDVPAAEVYATDRARISESDVLVCIALAICEELGEPLGPRLIDLIEVATRPLPRRRRLPWTPSTATCCGASSTLASRVRDPAGPAGLTLMQQTLRFDLATGFPVITDRSLRPSGASRSASSARSSTAPGPPEPS